MISFRRGLRSHAGLRAKLWSCVILFSLLLAQGGRAAPAPAVATSLPVAASQPGQATAQVRVDGDKGYSGPVYWDAFPQSYEIVTTPNGGQQIIPGPGSQVRLLVQLKGEPLAVYRQGLRSSEAAHLTAALEAYQAQLQTARRQVLADLQALGVAVEVNAEFSYLFNGVALSATEESRAKIAALPQVAGVFPDYQVKATLHESVPLIGAPDVWAMTDSHGDAVTGTGLRVAIIDTGVDYSHPDLGGCFGAGCKVAGGYDFANDDGDPADDNGHGTHVAGIVAADGQLQGVAPGASLLAYKVLNAYGYGSDSDIIAAIEAAADPDGNPATDDAVDVINMSLGGPGNPDDPFSQAVDHAVGLGIVVVVAAGNDWDYFTLGAPASARKAITVAASDKADFVAPFSSRGPVSGYFDLLKPDLAAPGVAISSTVPLAGMLGSETRYNLLEGTSMASPHVAGAAALLRQLHPAWPPEAIKAGLMNTALDLGADLFSQGAGRIRVNQAITTTSLVSPGALSFGLVDSGQPVWTAQRVVTVTNTSAAALDYTMTAVLPLTPTQGITVTVSPAAFTLAPAASRQVILTLDVNNALVPFGLPPTMSYEAALELDAGGQAIRIPYAFIKAASLTITFEDQLPWSITVHDHDQNAQILRSSQIVTETMVFLPPGTYDAVANFLFSDALAFQEGMVVTSTTRVTMRAGDVKNALTFAALDANGWPLPLTYETTYGVFMSGWSSDSGTVASESMTYYNEESVLPPTLHLSDVSDAYFFSARIPVRPVDRPGDYYEVFYPLDNGLSGSATLQNDPQQFRRQRIEFDPGMAYQAHVVTPMWFIAWPGITIGSAFSSWALPSTVAQTAYLPPVSSPFTKYYTGFGISSLDDVGIGVYQSALLYAVNEDRAVHLHTGFDPLPDVAQSNLLLGGSPLHWFGRLAVTPGQLVLSEAIPGYYGYLLDQGMGHAFTSPFTYTLAHAGIANEGVLPSDAYYQNSFNLSESGVYTMAVRHAGYDLGGRAGQGLAMAVFDTTRPDPNPPYLLTLNVLENGYMRDTISKDGVVRFSVGDDVGVVTATLALKLDDGAWFDVPLADDGDFYVADLSAVELDATAIASLRIGAFDEAGNTFSYEASPAFVLAPYTEKLFLPLVVR
ncbi:MAG: S8 family serine peptidase [Chloroflexota bacterium]